MNYQHTRFKLQQLKRNEDIESMSKQLLVATLADVCRGGGEYLVRMYRYISVPVCVCICGEWGAIVLIEEVCSCVYF